MKAVYSFEVWPSSGSSLLSPSSWNRLYVECVATASTGALSLFCWLRKWLFHTRRGGLRRLEAAANPSTKCSVPGAGRRLRKGCAVVSTPQFQSHDSDFASTENWFCLQWNLKDFIFFFSDIFLCFNIFCPFLLSKWALNHKISNYAQKCQASAHYGGAHK